MKLYKLTNQDGTTKGNTVWSVGTVHSKQPCDNPKLCTSDVFHAYTNVNLAYLLNPIHANINHPQLWECAGDIVVSDYGKVGVFELAVTKKLRTPKWVNSLHASNIKILFAILCAEAVLQVYESNYPNDNRPRQAIQATKDYLNNTTKEDADVAHAAYAAAHAAAHAAYAAYAAYAAAHAAAHAAYAAYAADAAYAAAHAADAAAHAADAAHAAAHAADAADAAADAADAIDFGELADTAVNTYMK